MLPPSDWTRSTRFDGRSPSKGQLLPVRRRQIAIWRSMSGTPCSRIARGCGFHSTAVRMESPITVIRSGWADAAAPAGAGAESAARALSDTRKTTRTTFIRVPPLLYGRPARMIARGASKLNARGVAAGDCYPGQATRESGDGRVLAVRHRATG